MKTIRYRKILCAVIVFGLIVSLLSSCGSPQNADAEEPTAAPEAVAEPTPGEAQSAIVSVSAAPENSPTPPTEEPAPITPSPIPTPEEIMTKEQQNSINMLNYLTVLVQEIRESKNSRLYLESAYSELINNTEPSIVDELTLEEYEDILTVIEDYRMTAVQRERLQYIYEQNKATAIRSAIPNPLAVLNIAQSRNPLKAIASLAYAAVDAVSSYESYTQQLDLQYLQDGWALDDKESADLHASRTSMFTYMVRVSRDLPTGITLNEEAVDDFVEWKNKENVTSRIRWLESNQSTYKFFGEYWLVLADSYYENENYEKCLEAITEYEALDNSIFRRDIRFAQTLPYAIVAAQETLDGDAYIELAAHFARLIEDNTDNGEWSLRYFAAQTYADLYAQTNDRAYLQSAYDLAYDNVNELVPKQHELNGTYLADVVEAKAGDDADKEEKETIKAYNKLLKETRKTELPPVYEPLRLNCELLLALADQLGVSQAQRADIDKILHPNGDRLFLNVPLDEQFRFSSDTAFDVNETPAEFSDSRFSAPKITIPALYVPDGASVTLTVSGGEETQVYSDWTLGEVDRNESEDPQGFIAVFSSNETEDADLEDGDLLTFTVTPPDGQDDVETLVIKFEVHKTSGFLGVSSLEFERISA